VAASLAVLVPLSGLVQLSGDVVVPVVLAPRCQEPVLVTSPGLIFSSELLAILRTSSWSRRN